jgi:hypothetical protein
VASNAERYADRIAFKRVFIDSFTPTEKHQFLDDLAIPDSDSTVRESLIRAMQRLPSSPGMMRILADLPLNSLREILEDADTDPDSDLTQIILKAWFPRAFRDADSMRLLASIAAAQCLQVNLDALRGADDWLSGLDNGTFAELIDEQIRRGHLKRSYNGRPVSIKGPVYEQIGHLKTSRFASNAPGSRARRCPLLIDRLSWRMRPCLTRDKRPSSPPACLWLRASSNIGSDILTNDLIFINGLSI